jgi:ferredoxin
MNEHKVKIIDLDACMECGACMQNCPVKAIRLTPGTGCASYIFKTWITGKKNASCGPAECC